MNNNKETERSKILGEIRDLHPDLQKFIGRDGIEIPEAKMDQFRRKEVGEKTKSNTILPLWSHRAYRAAAAVLVLLIGIGAILLIQRDEGINSYNGAYDHLALLEYLIEEAEYMDGDLLIDEIGVYYLEALELENLADNEVFFDDNSFNTNDFYLQDF